MTQDESQQIEELLLAWYAWQAAWAPALGAGRADPTCRHFQISKQWLSQEERREIEERAAAKRQAEQVDVCVSNLADWRHRAAIQVSMKNKTARAEVFRSVRLEGGDHEYYQAAKLALLPLLWKRGLIVRQAERCQRDFSGCLTG